MRRAARPRWTICATTAKGNRIEQRTVSGSTTTTTYYLLGGQEEVQIVSGGATTITKYYPTGSATHLPQPIKVGTTISYLATDGLDTVSEAVDSAGNVTAQQLYLPYGGSRYSNGTMPTSKGFTGQRADAATGLDYYGARYYDPVLGQFTSADDVLPGDGLDPWGLSRYAYVEGNPISRNDPTGHDWFSSALSVAGTVAGVALTVADAATGVSSMVNDVKTVFSDSASPLDKALAVGDLALNVAMDVSMVVGVGEGARAAYVAGKVVGKVAVEVGGKMAAHAVEDVAEHAAEDVAEHTGETLLDQAAGGGKRTLYKAIGETQLNDLLRLGDYGVNPSGFGNYFALTEQGARDFTKTAINAGRRMTITSTEIPESFMQRGFRFFDVKGAGESIYFDFEDGTLGDLYKVMSQPKILDAPWIRSIGTGLR